MLQGHKSTQNTISSNPNILFIQQLLQPPDFLILYTNTNLSKNQIIDQKQSIFTLIQDLNVNTH